VAGTAVVTAPTRTSIRIHVRRAAVLLAGAVACVAMFVVLLVTVSDEHGILAVDRHVEDFFGDHRGTWLYHLCAVFTRLSAYEVVLPFGIAAGLWLCWRRQAAWPVLFVLASFFPPALITGVLKYTVHRHEPFDLPTEPGRAFPSGHAVMAIAVYPLLAAILAMTVSSRRQARAAWMAAIAICALSALSMLYRGSHWLTDEVAGFALGGASLLVVLALVEGVRAIGDARPGRGTAAVVLRRLLG